jgi:ankyrin repeat protein
LRYHYASTVYPCRCTEQWACPNFAYFFLPLIIFACVVEQFSLVRTLLSTDRNLVNTSDADGRTALHWAASSGALDIVRLLIDKGAEVNKQDASGWTALHISGQP